MHSTISIILLILLWSASGDEQMAKGIMSALKDTTSPSPLGNASLVETALKTQGIPIDPDLPEYLQKRLIKDVLLLKKHGYDYFSKLARKKRDVSEYRGSFSSCPNRAEYVIIHSGRGYNRNVTLYTEPGYPHQFYRVSCNFGLLAMNNTATCPKCCLGADNTNYITECQTMRSYHPIKAVGDTPNSYRWSYILIDSMCLCDVLPRNQNQHQ